MLIVQRSDGKDELWMECMDEAAALVKRMRDGIGFGLVGNLDAKGFMILQVQHGLQVAKVGDEREYLTLVRRFRDAVTTRNAKRQGTTQAEKQALHEALERPMPDTPMPEDLKPHAVWLPPLWTWN